VYAPTKEILEKANREGYAVGAFNFNNMEFLEAIIEAAEAENAPVIVATSEGAMKYIGNGDPHRGAKLAVAMVKTLAESVKVPVALHLDHGKHLEFILYALQAGYSSVMIDLSALPFEENLKGTKEVVRLAHPLGISVEAELGKLAGIEDNVASRESVLVDPDEAKKFVEETEVDFLAPAIGTSHGAFKFKGEAKLDFDRLKKVKEYTKIPLVLHGASMVPQEKVELANKYGAEIKGAKGVPADALKKAIELGINKVNVDTDLRITFTAELRKVLSEKKSEIDPRKILGPGKEALVEIIKDRIRFLGSSGKA
jgi:fructose-bisphosphate aldolase class II